MPDVKVLGRGEIDRDGLSLPCWSKIATSALDLCRPSIGCFEMMPTHHVFLAGSNIK